MKTQPIIRRARLVLNESMISFRTFLGLTKTKKVIANMTNIIISKFITIRFKLLLYHNKHNSLFTINPQKSFMEATLTSRLHKVFHVILKQSFTPKS